MNLKCKKNNNKIKKQQMKIKKKLMDISLKVDHYIYKNRPISVADATSYYHEVISYQALCMHDERSLQVIEKLSRFMLAIIEEQNGNIVSETNFNETYLGDDSNQMSPVYSLTENDKYELQLNNGETASPQYVTDVNEQSIEYSSSVQSDINYKLLDKDEQNYNKEKENESVIDLTICEGENTNFNDTSGIDSQSILKNIVDPVMQNFYVDECGQDLTEIDRAVQDLLIGDKSDVTRENTKENENTHGPQYETIKTKDKEDVKNKSTNISVSKQLNNTKKRTYKSTKPRKTKHITNKNKQNKDKTKKRAKNIINKEKQDLPRCISNYCHESDFSWIENMKFVRQINPDEYDPSLATLGESLWDNFNLPIGWDEFD